MAVVMVPAIKKIIIHTQHVEESFRTTIRAHGLCPKANYHKTTFIVH